MPLPELALLPFMFVLGRVAGGWPDVPWLKLTLYKAAPFLLGAMLGYLVAGWSWLLIPAAIAGKLGECVSVGWPRGYIEHGISPYYLGDVEGPEWWQPRWTEDRPYFALALRGGVVGSPLRCHRNPGVFRRPDFGLAGFSRRHGGLRSGDAAGCVPGGILPPGGVVCQPLPAEVGLVRGAAAADRRRGGAPDHGGPVMHEEKVICRTCKQPKDPSELARNSKNRGGFDKQCRPCRAAQVREYLRNRGASPLDQMYERGYRYARLTREIFRNIPGGA